MSRRASKSLTLEEGAQWDTDFRTLKADQAKLAQDKRFLKLDGSAKGYGSEIVTDNQRNVRHSYSVDKKELETFIKAAAKGKPYEVETKTIPSPISEPGIPSILRPELTTLLPYEPSDVFGLFHRQIAPEGVSVSYVQHTGNAAEVAYTAELGTKPDLGPITQVVSQGWTKLAGTAEATTEALQDFPTYMNLLPQELFRSLANTTSNQAINGTGSGGALPGFTGLLNTTGILTVAQPTLAANTQLAPLVGVRNAISAIRNGSYFGEADLMIVNPVDWAQMSIITSTDGLFVLDPVNPNRLGDLNSVWGLDVVQTTQIAAGTAIILDRDAVWTWERQAPTMDTNQYGVSADGTHNLWQDNAVSFRVECRRAIGVPFPKGICTLTGISF
ncbi:hypothetical protein MHPYR_170002 [uncultured Mycobacterium sp.]|uniref:Phage capsid-like C-terminal domain-containing protein n=1 Tax=uncultured Mycobacterium sp. TaxID=171292 RepID=A0A1Y5PBX3_9MYCO|nr:hypothetical protein MHPYR_170002 [uncultured Mycobacterium sp.]